MMVSYWFYYIILLQFRSFKLFFILSCCLIYAFRLYLKLIITLSFLRTGISHSKVTVKLKSSRFSSYFPWRHTRMRQHNLPHHYIQAIVQFHVPAALHPGKDFLYEFQTHYENVGFEVLTAVDMQSSIIWNVTPCSPLKINRCFRPEDSECSSETSVDFRRATRRYIQENRILHFMKSYNGLNAYIHTWRNTNTPDEHRASWLSCNTSFVFGRHPVTISVVPATIPTGNFRGSPQALEPNHEQCPQLSHDRFISYTFQFMYHFSHHTTLQTCSLRWISI
jgi:hypothetical protein